MFQEYFKLEQNNTSIKTEITAGVTTFLTMAYIIVLNPIILADGGFDYGGVFVATIVATAAACFIMGLYAKTWPIGLAPGMGINAFVAYGVCKGMGYSPQVALGAVFISGVIFFTISLTPLRNWIINAIPKSLKLGIGAGIGLFLAMIGLSISGVVVDHPVTLVTLGNLKDPIVLLACLTFVTMVVLEKLNIKGNIILALLGFSIITWVTGLAKFNGFVGPIPEMKMFLTLDIKGALTVGLVSVIFTLFFIDFFDTAGTLTSVANVCGKVDKKGNVDNIGKPVLADSGATIIGSLFGTTNVTSYVESGSGVKAGGRTGLTSCVIGVLFLLCLFFAPLASSLPKQIDGAALVYVSTFFLRNITEIDWDDIGEYAPAVITMVAMPVTYSISHGIALGFVSYALVKIFTGKAKGVSPAIWMVAILGLISFWVR